MPAPSHIKSEMWPWDLVPLGESELRTGKRARVELRVAGTVRTKKGETRTPSEIPVEDKALERGDC